MGGCCSSQVGAAHAKHRGAGKRPATHDSAWSVDEPQTAAANGTAAGPDGSIARSAAQKQRAKKRVANVDMVTGQVIPDMGVAGVFDVLYELGSGGSGRTFLCRDLASGKVRAVKFVERPLAKAAIPFMMAEVEIQAELGEGCLNLIKMHEIVLTKTHLALVLEYASGGSLTEQVSCLWESALQRGGLFMEEQEASYYLRQVVHAVAFCHKHRVVHRDLKLDNTLLEGSIVGLPRIKICDFGFAKRWGTGGDQMHTAIGTPVYMAPQMLAARQCKSGYSGVKADMWAVGVLLYVMLLGTFPFDHDERHDPSSAEAANEVWLKQQQQGWRRHPRAADVLRRRVLSQECCDLLDQLLEMDEDKRPTTAEVLSHPWLSIALTQQQQAAWDALQQEQAALDRQLQAASNPRLARMRREAMFAMMAVTAKPPGPTLIPGPSTLNSAASGSVHGAAAGSSSRSDAGVEAAAAAATSSCDADAASPSSAGPLQLSPGDEEGVVALTSPASLAPAGTAAASGGGQPGFVAEIAEIAAAGGAEAAGAAVSSVTHDAQHLPPMQGEGLHSALLEHRVETHMQQAQQTQAARVATPMGAIAEVSHQPQQHQGSNGSAPAAQQGSSNSSATQPAGAAATAAAAAANKRGGKLGKSPFTAAAGGVFGTSQSGLGPCPEVAAAADAGADDADQPDEVWRLPLVSTADPSAFKLTPELSVAAGALIRQLQGSDKLPGRGRSSRSSCPMY